MKLKQAIHGLEELQKETDKQIKENNPSFLSGNIIKVQLYYDCDIVVSIEDKKV